MHRKPHQFSARRITGYLLALALILSLNLPAQRNRITGRIDNSRRVTLKGHIHPKAQADDDQGPVAASMPIPYATLVLKRSASQEAELNQLLEQQQDPSSPNYHHWLAPEEYADRFGASQEDIDKITNWLKEQGLNVMGVARGRNWIAFSGDAAQVESAFGAKIHHYLRDGKMHFANATEPSIPAAFETVVSAIHGLNDFRLKRPKHRVQRLSALPNYTSSRGNHYLAPDDVATIYNIKPLYNAGINGTGQSVAIVGQTQIKLSDIQQFRAMFNLPANDPQIVLVPNSRDPGTISDDLGEADLDLELSGAIARNANIIYVYATDVTDAAQYAIDQNLAPVLSMSYGQCEAFTSRSDAMALQSSAKQANAQGITWFAASGDSGATDCDGGTSRTTGRISVDLPAGIPEVTGIGGTKFNEAGGSFWSTSNDGNGSSAASYIQETAWNDTTTGDLASSGGGASSFFAKPAWQTGAGVPADNARDVPDVAFAASANHDGFMTYTGGSLAIVGGTSVGAPSFAGIAALLNHYLEANGLQSKPGLGNMNPRLYSLAQSNPGVFHDVTTGDNIINVTCVGRVRNCSPGSFGFSAAAGYDQVTGLGSVDAYNLATAWTGPSAAISKSAVSMTLQSDATSITPAGSAVLTATIKSANGGVPSGTVSFYLGSVLLGTATLTDSGGLSTATLTLNGAQLTVGDDAITAQYIGDNLHNGASAFTNVTVITVGTGPPLISSVANAASFRRAFAPGMILTVFGSQLAPVTESASNTPLPLELGGVSATINGIGAPLYYVSPGQLNIQIPYETPINSTALLNINNNGQGVSTTFAVAAAAPGIFVDKNGAVIPDSSARRGQVITMFINGAGAVSPPVATGSALDSTTAVANLPTPTQPVTVTVGGVTAPVQFVGVPAGQVGVIQINYQVPAGTAVGVRQVVVTVGGVSSIPANLNVTG